MNRQKFAVLTFAAVVALVWNAVIPARAEDRSAEVKSYTEALDSSNVSARITALKKITNAGLTDRALFDLINERLLAGYLVAPDDQKKVDEVSWLCKALASSGMADYRATLGKVAKEAPSEKVRNYADQSLGLVDSYAQRNALLTKQTAETEGLAPEAARLVNMLRSPDDKLRKDASKVITRANSTDPKVYEVVSEELLAGLKQGTLSAAQVDTLAWLCKALAASGDGKYRSTLEHTYKVTGDEKLRKYAKQSLDTLR